MMAAIRKCDEFTFLGGAFLVLARSNRIAIFGAVLLASGNPEQAILASCALLLLRCFFGTKVWLNFVLVQIGLGQSKLVSFIEFDIHVIIRLAHWNRPIAGGWIPFAHESISFTHNA